MSLSSLTVQIILRRVVHVALAVVFAVEIFSRQFSAHLDSLFILLATVTSIVSLAEQLPLQNVLLAAAITAAIGGIAHGLSGNPDLSIPFGPIVFNNSAKIFNAVPWTIPLLWIVVLFNARGVGRLMLRPWRKLRNYGFWLIGATAVLTLAFDLALEPFATRVKHWWLWTPTKFPVTWLGTPLINFVGWLFISLLMLAFITPSLIKKQPGSSGAVDYQPLIIWLGALFLFGIGAAQSGLWLAVLLDMVIAIVTATLAVRGARW